MKSKTSIFIVSSVSLLFAGCSTVDNFVEQGKIDYKSAAKRPSLEVPPDLTAPGRVDRGTSSGTVSASTFQQGARTGAVPTNAAVLPTVPGVKFERQGSQRWLAVDMKPEVLWPIVRDFWVEQGFALAVQSPQTGVLETDWAENRAKIPNDTIRSVLSKAFDSLYSTGERDKFRVRIDTSGSGSELYLSHRGMIEVITGATKESSVWQARPNDPDLEAEFLRRIVLRLGADNNRAQAIATAAKVNQNQPGAAPAAAASSARLTGSGAAMALELANENFDRAWRRVGLALEKGSFTVEDRNRADGIYFVRYVDPELEANSQKEKGFLSKIFSREQDVKAKTYRVSVKASGPASIVTVNDATGASLRDPTDIQVSQRILALLQEQLK
jgi:outer membrane protein assembly factor BamC